MVECKKLAKEGRLGAAKILAKEVIGTRKAVERMLVRSNQHESIVSRYVFSAATYVIALLSHPDRESSDELRFYDTADFSMYVKNSTILS